MNETCTNILKSKKSTWMSQYGLTRIAVFGKQLRRDARPESDLDTWANLQSPLKLDLLQFISLGQELEKELDVPVNYVLESDLKPGLRVKILREAVYL